MLVACPKKSDDNPVSIMPVSPPLPFDEDAFDDLPEAGDTANSYYEEIVPDDEDKEADPE